MRYNGVHNRELLLYANGTRDFIGKGPLDDQPSKHKTSEILEQTVDDVYKGIQESISIPEIDAMVKYIQTNHDRYSYLSPLPPPPPPPSGQLPPPLPPISQETQMLYRMQSRGSVEMAHTNICCACLRRRPQQNQRPQQIFVCAISTDPRLRIRYSICVSCDIGGSGGGNCPDGGGGGGGSGD
ncbi:unnamed protein product, partial [Rotaria sp. Silwood1]